MSLICYLSSSDNFQIFRISNTSIFLCQQVLQCFWLAEDYFFPCPVQKAKFLNCLRSHVTPLYENVHVVSALGLKLICLFPNFCSFMYSNIIKIGQLERLYVSLQNEIKNQIFVTLFTLKKKQLLNLKGEHISLIFYFFCSSSYFYNTRL